MQVTLSRVVGNGYDADAKKHSCAGRLPYGEFNCLILPRDSQEKENDYVVLSDIFPTGYHATELDGVQPGDNVVIYGAGPVGLMAACSATIKGAAMVMVVDTHTRTGWRGTATIAGLRGCSSVG